MNMSESNNRIWIVIFAMFMLILSACFGPAADGGSEAEADCLIKTDQGVVLTKLNHEKNTATAIRTEQLDSYKGKSYWNDQMIFPTEHSIALVRQNGINDGMSLVIQDRNFQDMPIEAKTSGSVNCMTVNDGKIYLADCSVSESTVYMYDWDGNLLDTVIIDLPDTEFFMITAMLPDTDNGGLWLLCGSLASMEQGDSPDNYLIRTNDELQIENILDLNISTGSLFSMTQDENTIYLLQKYSGANAQGEPSGSNQVLCFDKQAEILNGTLQLDLEYGQTINYIPERNELLIRTAPSDMEQKAWLLFSLNNQEQSILFQEEEYAKAVSQTPGGFCTYHEGSYWFVCNRSLLKYDPHTRSTTSYSLQGPAYSDPSGIVFPDQTQPGPPED